MNKHFSRYGISAVISIVLIAVIALVSSFYLQNAISRAVYDERSESLYQLLSVCSNSVDGNISTQHRIADVYRHDVIYHLIRYRTVEEYLVYLKSQLADKDDYYFLVDSMGRYYCTDGKSGRIVATSYYLDDSEDEIEYLDTLPHLNDNRDYLILRDRLESPVYLNSKNGYVEIRYCALMHNISPIVQDINSLFGSDNNVLIFDRRTGRTLYKQLSLGL